MHHPTTPVLTTNRMNLRPPQQADWPAYCAYRLSDRSTLTGPQRTETVARTHFDEFFHHWQHRGFGRFVMVDTASGAAIGHVGPFEPTGHPERELTWTLWSAAHEGKGYAFEAAVAARHHAFATLGWPTAVSYIVPDNHRSQRLAQRLGAVLDRDAPAPAYDGGCLVYRHARQVAA
jgi:RimJ/RimL family protein N-acetyltransferase